MTNSFSDYDVMFDHQWKYVKQIGSHANIGTFRFTFSCPTGSYISDFSWKPLSSQSTAASEDENQVSLLTEQDISICVSAVMEILWKDIQHK